MQYTDQLRMPRIALLLVLCAGLPSHALASGVHNHGTPPKPRTPIERVIDTFMGRVPDKLPQAKATAISDQVAIPGRESVNVRTIFVPSRLMLARTEAVRMNFETAESHAPLAGYAPKIEIAFPSGAVSRGQMEEIAGYPGLYEYWATWKEPGPADVRVSIGQGEQAPLPGYRTTLYTKAPPVPLLPWLFVGGLAALLLGVAVSVKLTGPKRLSALLIAGAVGLGGAFLVRAPIAAKAGSVVAAEQAYLAELPLEHDVAWPEAKTALDLGTAPTTSAIVTPTDTPIGISTGLPDGATMIRGQLITPDDARAVVSSPYIGLFSTNKLLPRGTVVKKGQALGSIRVNNEAIAPDAAASPGTIASAASDVAAAESRLAQAEAELERGETLWNSKAIARQELEHLGRAVEQAQASLDAAEGALAAAKNQGKVLDGLGGARLVRSHALTSPIDGVIAEIGVAAGEALTEGQMIYTIIDPARLWIEAQVFEDQLPGLVPGTQVECLLVNRPDRRFTATLRSLGVAFSSETHTLPVLLEVTGDLDGLFAGQPIALLLPEAAD